MNDMLSQEEIEAMMAGLSSDDSPSDGGSPPSGDDGPTTSTLDDMLTDDERDILGEVGNICMGTSATTMYTLLGHRVSITTPNVHVFTREEILSAYSRPYIAVDVKYVEGVFGSNLLMLKEEDAMKITDIMMGGEGIVDPDMEFGELQLSAMSEVMNQMVGSSAISLANLLHDTINIAPPTAIMVDFASEVPDSILEEEGPYVKIDFDMEIEDVLDSKLMQIQTVSFAKDLVSKIVMMEEKGELTASQEADALGQPLNAKSQPDMDNIASTPAEPHHSPYADPNYGQNQQQQAPPQGYPQQPYPDPAYGQPPGQQPYPPQGYPQQPYPPQPYPPQPYPPQGYPAPQPGYAPPPGATMAYQSPVDVQSAQFQPFDGGGAYAESYGDIKRIIDVPLQVTVELGKTKKSIREVLDMSSGSIVVLDKLAGEHVEVLVNGKLVARGEVVVIEESYGVRITEILNLPAPTY